jgi:hypothetical protein
MRPTVVTVTANTTSEVVPLDINLGTFNVGMAITATQNIAATVQVSLDDPFVTDQSGMNWFSAHDATLVGATGNIQGAITEPCRAVRLNVTSGGTGASGVKLTIVQIGVGL